MHDCKQHLVIVHAEGSDTRHVLVGVMCPCLPKAFCAICNRVLAELGEVRSLGKTEGVHVYPAWQDEEE